MNKSALIDLIKIQLSDKIKNFENLIAETRAANNDTKSSMGDKYETSREMIQQEINRLHMQLHEVLKQQEFLKTIVVKSFDKADKGAVVKTEKGVFFISVSLGEITFENQKLICISPESPLAIAMKGKRKDEIFSLNKMNQKIVEIY